MEPGRELDALMAEYIEGCYMPRAYSTDVAAAFTVDKSGWLWEFKEMPETLTVVLYTSFALRRQAMEMYPILPKKVILIRREWLEDKSRTYAWLRCLAALEAVRVDVETGRLEDE